MIPIGLTVGGPEITATVLYQYRAAPVDFFVGQVTLAPDRSSHDPEVWPLASLKRNPDGEPATESLHANHNADMRLDCDGQSLIGRSDAERGIAHKIDVVTPLYLADNQLHLDTTGLGGGGPGGGIPEAPINSVAHGRRNAAWTPVLMVSGDVMDGGNF